jgi:acyl-CoA thioester hydrolase
MRFHETIHGVYFDDLDAFHILHNARYLLLFEHAIGSFWRHLGWAGVLDFNTNPDQYHLVRANSLDYQRPVIGTGQVRVRVWVERLGRTSLTFGLRVMPLDEDIDHATGRRTVVRVDPETKRPCAWTAAFRAEIAPYCAHIEVEAGQ